MKYASLKQKNILQYSVKDFSNGVNPQDEPEFIDSGQLSLCKNMWYKNGSLTARSGFVPDGDIIVRDTYGMMSLLPFTVTNTVYHYDGKNCRIAYMANTDYTSSAVLNCFFVDDDGKLKDIGSVDFNRVSDDEFYLPDNVFFAVGNSEGTSSGIYMFVRTTSASQNDYRTYVLSNDYTYWQRIYNTDYYSPTVYAFGRGTRAAEAIANDFKFSEEPQMPEEFSMISEGFKAYFTTDGYSSDFKLPFRGIDSKGIVIDFYADSQKYRWVINYGSSASSIYINGQYVTANFNRQDGILFFSVGGSRYSLSRMYNVVENNLVIMANKQHPEDTEKIFTSKGSIVFGSKIYIYGNDVCPNEIYETSVSNVLYIKNNIKSSIGDSGGPVTGMSIQNNKLIAFKANEIYRLDITKTSDNSNLITLPDYDGEYTESRQISAVLIHSSIGCDCPETIQVCADKSVWLNSSGAVYLLATTTYGKENNVYKISSKIADALKEFSKNELLSAKAGNVMGHYMLFIGKKAFLFDYCIKGFGYSASYMGDNYRERSVAWYIWDFKGTDFLINTVISNDSKLSLLFSDDNLNIIYKVGEGDFYDAVLNYSNGNTTREISRIDYEMSTKNFNLDLPHTKKEIQGIYITAKTESSFNATVNYGIYTLEKGIEDCDNRFKSFCAFSGLMNVDYFKITLKSNFPFSVGGMLVRFKTLK